MSDIKEQLNAPLRTGSTGLDQEEPGKFPFEAFEFESPTDTNPNLILKDPWDFKIEHNLNVSAGSIITDDNWHNVGESGEPAFQNNWVNYNTATYIAARFIKHGNGQVEVQAVVKDGNAPTVFYLPTGYRPLKNVMSIAVKNGETGCRLIIYSAGNVHLSNYSATYTGFDITFKAEQ